MEDALVKIQEILSHHDDEIARLSGELHAQQREIARLQAQINQLQSNQQRESSIIRNPDEETPPPHY